MYKKATPTAKAIGITNPINLENINTPEELIVYCARVSNPKNQNNTETVDNLLGYLIKHKHWSPFEMVDICVEINTTRDISRQVIRHRSFSFQEFSQRYENVTELDDVFVLKQARMQDHKNRQNSIKTDDMEIQETWKNLQTEVLDVVVKNYKKALDMGIAKEVARCLLPEGLTMSKMYMKGSIRSWIHYLEIRTGEETQLEHRELALEIAKGISSHVPSLIKE